MRLSGLKEARLLKALTQQELADLSRVHRVTIAELEAGREGVLPTTLRKLANALGVAPERLLRPSPLAEYPVTPSPVRGVSEAAPVLAESEELSLLIEIPDPGAVNQFLSRHPEVGPVLREAPQKIASFFPEGSLHLLLMRDPEYPDDEELFLAVHTSLDGEAAARNLRALDQSWWLRRAPVARGLLCIDVRRE